MAEFKQKRFTKSPNNRPFSHDASRPRELFDARCNKCQAQCQVPFRPNGMKPVYCSNCFVRDDSQGSSPSYGAKKDFGARRPNGAPSYSAPASNPQIEELKKQVASMNATLEKLVSTVEAYNRATSLTSEIRKHLPAAEPEAAVTKAPKKIAKKATKAAKK